MTVEDLWKSYINNCVNVYLGKGFELWTLDGIESELPYKLPRKLNTAKERWNEIGSKHWQNDQIVCGSPDEISGMNQALENTLRIKNGDTKNTNLARRAVALCEKVKNEGRLVCLSVTDPLTSELYKFYALTHKKYTDEEVIDGFGVYDLGDTPSHLYAEIRHGLVTDIITTDGLSKHDLESIPYVFDEFNEMINWIDLGVKECIELIHGNLLEELRSKWL